MVSIVSVTNRPGKIIPDCDILGIKLGLVMFTRLKFWELYPLGKNVAALEKLI